MRKVRLFALILLCAILLVCAVGCVQSVNVTQYLDGNGSFHRNIVISYDLQSTDAAAIRAEIKEVMSRYVKANELSAYATISEETEGVIRLDLSFPSVEDYYIWLGYTGREANDLEIPTKRGLVDAYDRSVANYLTEKTVEEIRAFVSDEYRDFPLTAEFYYTYGTTNRSTISNGSTSEKDGIYYHTWKIDPNAPTEMKIRIYGLNVMAIYLIAILIFVLSLAIIFVIIYINKRKQKKSAALPHDDPRLSEPTLSTAIDPSEEVALSRNEDDKE